jgi:hypothetical protein
LGRLTANFTSSCHGWTRLQKPDCVENLLLESIRQDRLRLPHSGLRRERKYSLSPLKINGKTEFRLWFGLPKANPRVH